MKYMLARIENGNEVVICYGSSYEGMKRTVENSKDMFREGYVIYELNMVEYG